MKILGIDLSGKEDNPSGICILEEDCMDFSTLYLNSDILKLIQKSNPSLIVFDAPLSLPKGRCCLEKDCDCAVGGHFRQAERDIRQYGNVLPLTFRGMKMLTLRGVGLASKLKKKYNVIESHPRTSQKILEFKDPSAGLGKYFTVPQDASEHELDAGILALTGFMYLEGCCIELGDQKEGLIIIPQKSLMFDCLRPGSS